MDRITSIKDKRIELARTLASRSGREGSNSLLLEGLEIVNWAQKAGWDIDYLLVEEHSLQLLEQLDRPVQNVYVVSAGILKKVTDTSYLIPLAAVTGTRPHHPLPGDFCIVLDQVKDFGNIGTIVRTGSAFGVTEFIATQPDFDPFYRKTIEASRGRVFHSRFRAMSGAVQTIAYLRKRGFQIITTSPYGSTVQSMVELDDRPIALVIGNESNGICEEILAAADRSVLIPMNSEVESLNVGVATGISVYELKMRWIMNGIEQRIRTTLGRQVNVLGQHIRTLLDRELADTAKLDSRQLVFLMVLQCEKSIGTAQALRENGLLEEEWERFTAPLLSQGLVEIRDGSVYATRQTEEVLAKLWAIKDRAEQKILSCLSIDERQAFNQLLDRLVDHCQKLVCEETHSSVGSGTD